MSEQLTQRIAEVLRQEIMVKRSGVFINKADPEAVAEAVVAALQPYIEKVRGEAYLDGYTDGRYGE